jgi:FKBP-type peptidyl-prolyl cis-trans isomerase
MRRLHVTTFVVALCVSSAACGSSYGSSNPTSPSSATVSFSQTDLRVGTGAEAQTGRGATVNYTGWLYDASRAESKGLQFDSSLSPGRTPFTFTIGVGSVIRGWDQGVPGMRVGGQRRLIIPANLGYGATGSPPAIPPNAALVFDIELLGVS